MGSQSICFLASVDMSLFQMKMTYDDQYLITISEDSCIMIWKVQDREGRNLKRDKELSYAEEILITKSDLEDKVCSFVQLTIESDWNFGLLCTFDDIYPTCFAIVTPVGPITLFFCELFVVS